MCIYIYTYIMGSDRISINMSISIISFIVFVIIISSSSTIIIRPCRSIEKGRVGTTQFGKMGILIIRLLIVTIIQLILILIVLLTNNYATTNNNNNDTTEITNLLLTMGVPSGYLKIPVNSTARKGTNGVSTNGVIANFMMFDRGTLWVLALTYCCLPKSARAYLFLQSVDISYFCSGPISVDPICPPPSIIYHNLS